MLLFLVPSSLLCLSNSSTLFGVAVLFPVYYSNVYIVHGLFFCCCCCLNNWVAQYLAVIDKYLSCFQFLAAIMDPTSMVDIGTRFCWLYDSQVTGWAGIYLLQWILINRFPSACTCLHSRLQCQVPLSTWWLIVFVLATLIGM